jgi:tRNA threonylcarbamoyladenosine biosynthesis protein TsaB
MIALGVDTSTPAGSVALVSAGRILGEINLEAPGHHQERLLRVVDLLLDLSGTRMADVEVLGVGLGPGTFTGLRIGIATVKGLALAGGIPAHGFSTLEAMARTYRDRGLPVAPMIDAGRGEVYAGLFDAAAEAPRSLLKERGGSPREFLEALPDGPVLFCGDAAFRNRDLIAQVRGSADWVEPNPCFLGGTLARWAAERQAGRMPWSLSALQPNYIRPPDAEIRPRR